MSPVEIVLSISLFANTVLVLTICGIVSERKIDQKNRDWWISAAAQRREKIQDACRELESVIYKLRKEEKP